MARFDADYVHAIVDDQVSIPRPYPHLFDPGCIQDVIWMPLRKRCDANGWRCALVPLHDFRDEFNLAMASMRELAPGTAHGQRGDKAARIVLCFLGPSTFQLLLRDSRPTSPTYRMSQIESVGEANPMAVIVPAGVAYISKNVGREAGLVITCPSRINASDNP